MKSLFILFVFITVNGLSQNLVNNNGFEDYSICPDDAFQISNAMGWSSYRETPDYLNSCSLNPIITQPNSWNGFQYPHNGNAYAGLVACNGYGFRELIGSGLKTTLIVEQKYFVSFYVNLGGSILHGATIANNNLGVKFSTVSFSWGWPAPITNSAHVYTNNIVTDTVKWTKISGSFVADSAYSYIMIGNFFDESHTDTINLSTVNNYAYYFIDDICVTTDSLFNENWTGIKEQSKNKEEITIYPNPCTTKLTVQFSKGLNEKVTYSLINATGKTMLQATTTENEYTFNTEKLAKGLYLVKVDNGSGVALTKVTKE